MVEDNIKALAEAHEACEQRLAQLTEQGLSPVSYTHLTLPTIS